MLIMCSLMYDAYIYKQLQKIITDDIHDTYIYTHVPKNKAPTYMIHTSFPRHYTMYTAPDSLSFPMTIQIWLLVIKSPTSQTCPLQRSGVTSSVLVTAELPLYNVIQAAQLYISPRVLTLCQQMSANICDIYPLSCVCVYRCMSA